MPSSGTLRRGAVVRTGVSEERSVVFLRSVRRLLVTANVPSPPILVTLMMEALRSSGRRFLTRVTRRHIPEDDILHSHHRENLKSDIILVKFQMPGAYLCTRNNTLV
jgi:hypothetical protein